MATKKQGTAIASANPTKSLFIDTLTRDVDLPSSLLDLIDNSIDGARRSRPDGKFAGLKIELVVSPDRFVISDNAGGIDLATAKNYAFRFGRDDNAKNSVKHSVGNFGVGMKRTLFKLAKHFKIDSVTAKSRFTLDLDVDDWKNRPKWEFELTNVSSARQKPADIGTSIEVDSLRPDIAGQFALEEFRNDLRERIRIAHQHALTRGLKIIFNKVELSPEKLTLVISDEIVPYRNSMKQTVEGKAVKVSVLVGVEKNRDLEDCGWYVFCNDRLLLRADKSKVTGWGSGMPKAHQQFDRFRGYVFFDADDASALPWNTTKTGFSENSDLYRFVRGVMVAAGSMVTGFLNKVREEEVESNEDKTTETPFADAIDAAESRELPAILRDKRCSATFTWPKSLIRRSKKIPQKRISYLIDEDKFDQAMEQAKANSSKELGLITFGYYYSNEVE